MCQETAPRQAGQLKRSPRCRFTSDHGGLSSRIWSICYGGKHLPHQRFTGKYFKGGQAELVAARRRTAPHGPIAHRLWQFIGSAGLTASSRQRA